MNKGSIVAIDTPDRLRKTTETMQMVEVAFDRKVEQAWFLTGYISRAELCNDKWRFYADDLDKAIEQIVKVKEEQGVKILSMSTSGPTLEDVFVKLCEVH